MFGYAAEHCDYWTGITWGYEARFIVFLFRFSELGFQKKVD
jgi:hypothetical protein